MGVRRSYSRGEGREGKGRWRGGCVLLWVCGVLVLHACGGDGSEGDGGPSPTGRYRRIRVFAVSNHMLFRDGVSPEAFEAKMRALMDERYRTGDLVQPGVPDVASHLLGPEDPAEPVGTARDLVVFTEDVGLILTVQGERAARFRNPDLDAMNALVGIAVLHLPQVLLNMIQYDVSVNRALFLSLTDKFWRAFDETFSAIARDYGVYVAACEDVADARLSTDPLDLLLYGDPEHPERTDVWLPRDGEVYNQTVIYDPEGRIVHRTRKVYLTSPEEDPAFFNLSFGRIEDVRPLDTSLGRLGVAISKDAWMADYIDRLDQMGVQLVIQPDADLGGWATIKEGNEVWYPDNWEAGNYMHVQKYPSIRHNVTPMMTGNLYEFRFDGQGSIMSDTAEGDPLRGFVGQIPDRGFAAVGRWAIEDPGRADPGLTLEQRRAVLMERAREMAPRSGSPLENAFGESVIWADLAVPVAEPLSPPAGGETALGEARRVCAGSVPGPQWNPSIAIGPGETIHVAWTDLRDGNEDVYAARSLDGGTSFEPERRVDDSGEPRFDQQDNQWDVKLAADPGGSLLVAAWTDFRSDNWEIYLARSLDGGRSWSRPAIRVDGAGDATVTGENLLYDPRAFFDDQGNLFVVWTDNRSVSDTDIFLRESRDGGLNFEEEVRVDDTGDGTLHDEAGPTGLGHTCQFHPDGAARAGRVYVAWQDMRNGLNQIFFGVSADGGRTFGPSLCVDPSGGAFHHQYLPSVALDGAGRVYVAWQDARHDSGDIYLTRSDDGGLSFGAAVRVDDSGTSFTTQSYPRVGCDPSGERLYVVWRDDRYGTPDLRIAVSRDGGRTFSPSRPVAARGREARFPPEIAVDASGTAFVVWHEGEGRDAAAWIASGRLD